ncbi:hypothetical protein L208DRAFT_1378865 [Tricholoma matsutake]|nr:hypothetical protein L208DRAFT_1378865 [Tricholoma matsutake 945]
MMTPPVSMQPEKSAQAPNPNIDDDDSDDLPLRVMATDGFPIHCGVKRKSLELGTGMNVRQPVPQSLAWGDLQDAIVEKAADALGLSMLICNYDIFETLFAIPRKIPDPTPLQTENNYEILLKSINNMKEPAINIFVCHLKPVKKRKKTKGKENQSDHSSSSDSSSLDSDSDGSGSEQKKKGKRKSKKGKGKKKKKSKLEDEVTENVKCLSLLTAQISATGAMMNQSTSLSAMTTSGQGMDTGPRTFLANIVLL